MSGFAEYTRRRRKFLIAFGILLSLIAISGPAYRFFGTPLIESAYRGESFPFLNRLIEDRARRPLETYLEYGRSVFNRFRGYSVSLLFFPFSYFLYTLLVAAPKGKLQNIGILILTVVLLFGTVELVLKYTLPVQIGEITFANFRASPNPKIILEPRPLAGEFNSRGLRDREYTYAKPEGVYRILVIGDSLAYGWRVPRDKCYAKELEKLLNSEAGGKKRYQVINMGVPGYRAVQIVERAKEEGLKYDPDLIIYGYWLDDITYSGFTPFSLSPANVSMSDAINELMSRRPFERRMKKFLLKSQLVRRAILLVRETVLRKKYQGSEEESLFRGEGRIGELPPELGRRFREYREGWERGEYRDPPRVDPYFRMYTDPEDFLIWNESLAELSRLCRAKGIGCLLLITPVLYEHEGEDYGWEPLHAFIAAVGHHHSIPTLDLTVEFEKYQPFQVRAGDHEHPNGFGHRIIAEKLYEWIIAREGRL